VSWTESSPRPGAGNRAAAHAVEAPKAHAPADKATAAPVHEDDGKKSSLSVYSDSTFLPGTSAFFFRGVLVGNGLRTDRPPPQTTGAQHEID
jgi:hypothetical protein